jgi:dTMP kinase
MAEGYMKTDKGVFVVIEGTDGSGKHTQFQRLAERLAREGYDVATFDFPQYSRPSSYFVKQYLSGAYGGADDVGPYTGSLFYALDRFEVASKIRQAIDAGKVVLANRFVGSNMAHQGTKFQYTEERRGYFIWLDNLEFEMLRIPRPTVSLVLRVPADIAHGLAKKRAGQQDRQQIAPPDVVHEADPEHSRRAVTVYDDICQLFPKDFSRIDCTRDEKLLDIDTIHNIVWQKIEPLLPPKPDHVSLGTDSAKTEATTVQSSIVEEKPDGSQSLTTKARELVEALVTREAGNVYFLTEKLTPFQTAAMLSRLAKGQGTPREQLLESDLEQLLREHELDETGKKLLDDTVVVEHGSQLLAAKLQRGRGITYAAQPLHAAHHDQKNADGGYRYYMPEHLEPRLAKEYRTQMDNLFDLYSDIVHGVTGHLLETSTTPESEQDSAWRSNLTQQAYAIARAVLPVAATSAVGLHSSLDGLENTVRRLLGEPLPEARRAVEAILSEAKRIDPEFLNRLNKAESGLAITYRADTRQKTAKLAKKYLVGTHAEPTTTVQLTDVHPRNELNIVPDMLYEVGDMPWRELQKTVAGWPYEQRLDVFGAYLSERVSRRQRPGRALENIHYRWDIVSSFGTFREMQLHQHAPGLEWQELTPRFGYEVPKRIEDADLLEEFETAFEISLKLHSLLQKAGLHLEAQYATLLGHNMRWKMSCNAREMFSILEPSHAVHPDMGKLLAAMHEKLLETHPLLGEVITFTASKSKSSVIV